MHKPFPTKDKLFQVALSSLALLSVSAWGTTVDVTSTTDDGSGSVVGTLSYAIKQVNATLADTITFSTLAGKTISLLAPLPPLVTPIATPLVTIIGPSATMPVTINGGSASQAFYILTGTVNISNLNLSDCQALGGSGAPIANNQGGGGGGAGAGGGLVVHDVATVMISNVNLSGNRAVGGNGANGANGSTSGGGAGGFCGGMGTPATQPVGGGGGGGDPQGTNAIGGVGGNGGDGTSGAGPGSTTGSAGGGGGSGGGGGQPGGPGANGINSAIHGGGVGGTQSPPGTGGGGGGGGTGNGKGGAGGAGGFGAGGGGGGGCTSGQTSGGGGIGGFGGGGGGVGIAVGGAVGTPGTSTFGGGSGGQSSGGGGPSGGGGGGAGLGGAIFVRNSGILTIVDGSTSGNSVTAGQGGLGQNGTPSPVNNGGNGQALGQDIFLMSGGTLNFNISSSYTISTAIESDLNQGGFAGGGVTKSGAGTLFFSNNSNHTYTGGTVLNAGTLNVNGSLIGTVTVNTGAVLSGNLVLNSHTNITETNPGNIINSGTVSPGNSIGTMTIAGNYTQNANANLNIEIDGAGDTDQLLIAGTASLNGNLVVTPLPGNYLNGQTYIIINATAGRSGTFSQFTFEFPSNGRITAANLMYLPNQVELILQAFPLLEPLAQGENHRTIAGYLDSLSVPVGSDIRSVILALASLDQTALNCALNQIQPTLFGAFAVVEEEGSIQVRSTISHRTDALHSTGCTTPSYHKFTVWSEGFGGFMRQRHFYQTPFKTHNLGVSVGVDYSLLENVYLGALGSYNHNHISWPTTCSKGHGEINSYYGGIYATGFNRYFFADISFLGAKNDYEATRKINFDSIDRKAKSDHDGYDLSGNLSVGGNWNDIVTNTIFLQPFGRFDYLYLHQDHFSEHGADSLDLFVNANHSSMLRSELGVNLAYCYQSEWGDFSLTPGISWVNETRFENHDYKAALKEFRATNGGFVVKTGNPSRNLAAPAVILAFHSEENHFRIAVTYDGEFGRHVNRQECSGRLDFKF